MPPLVAQSIPAIWMKREFQVFNRLLIDQVFNRLLIDQVFNRLLIDQVFNRLLIDCAIGHRLQRVQVFRDG
jgi:hypothetical protein